MSNNEQPIIVKKIKKGGHGHHGGAWKVAYADFVTAMMAFFLMLWLINTTTPEQKRGIADYFAVASLSESKSGAGGVLGGQSFDSDGSRRSGSSSIVQSQSQPQPSGQKKKSGNKDGTNAANAGGNKGEQGKSGDTAKLDDDALDKALARREQEMFERAAQSLRQAIEDLPELAELSKNLIIDQTPEGLRIQIVDQEGRPMFLPGQEKPIPRAEKLLEAVAKIIDRLPNRISISGHTDSVPFVRADGYSNWELSAGRANESRKVLQRGGIKNDRIYQVTGKAGSEPLFPDDPYLVGNRRISIVLLREAPVLPPSWR